jgi:hypothetical protein
MNTHSHNMPYEGRFKIKIVRLKNINKTLKIINNSIKVIK